MRPSSRETGSDQAPNVAQSIPETPQRPLFSGGEEHSAPRPAPDNEVATPARNDERSSGASSGGPTAANGDAQAAFPWDGNRGAQDRGGSTVERVVSSINREAHEAAAKETSSSGPAPSANASRETESVSVEKRYEGGQSDKTNNV